MSQEPFSFLAIKGDATLLSVYVQPKAGKSELAGIFQERLKVRINAPPVDGEANKECVNFLAGMLGVAKSEISLVRGGQSRQKTFLITRSLDFICEKLKKAGFAG
ncbi:MAG: DUF167 domain-containing protein [Syntrophobacteraceae bacterium]